MEDSTQISLNSGRSSAMSSLEQQCTDSGHRGQQCCVWQKHHHPNASINLWLIFFVTLVASVLGISCAEADTDTSLLQPSQQAPQPSSSKLSNTGVLDVKGSNSVPSLFISDSGELSVMSKRSRGFLPSRGKKDPGTNPNRMMLMTMMNQIPMLPIDGDESELFDESKRANGFLPMRGRKWSELSIGGNSDDGDSITNNPDGGLVDKRRISSFMAMRGRKASWNDNSKQHTEPVNGFVPPAARSAIYYYQNSPLSGADYHPVPQYTKLSFRPMAVASDESPVEMNKRKGVAFFGSRGKRMASTSLFVGSTK